jgi:hypothetical protein
MPDGVVTTRVEVGVEWELPLSGYATVQVEPIWDDEAERYLTDSAGNYVLDEEDVRAALHQYLGEMSTELVQDTDIDDVGLGEWSVAT